MDVDTIPLGVDFRKHITDAVARCDVMLAIIGDGWLVRTADGAKRRIDDPTDFVRVEIDAALSRDIPVVPVLVGNARMPAPQDLPPALEPLAFRNATELRAGRDLDHHVGALIRGLRALLPAPPAAPPSPTGSGFALAPKKDRPPKAHSKEWSAAFEGSAIRVTNWWAVVGVRLEAEAELYVDGVCLDRIHDQGNVLRGMVKDRRGSEHVLEVRFGGLFATKAQILVDGQRVGGDTTLL